MRRWANYSPRWDRKEWVCSTVSPQQPMPTGGCSMNKACVRSWSTSFRISIPKTWRTWLRKATKAERRILETPLPETLRSAVLESYRALIGRLGREPAMAVRSSASAEDLPEASFAGAAETFLNVRGEDALLRAVHQCFASLFTDRAISYRARQGFSQLKVALSVGVMPMVRSDLASSGVIFTLDTESGFRDVVTITGSYGLGEFIVQGVVTPDEWLVFKPTLRQRLSSPLSGGDWARRKSGWFTQRARARLAARRHPRKTARVTALLIRKFSQLARWACLIEEHYSEIAKHPQPMDIEWAKDGVTGELFIVQARPETVHSAKRIQASAQMYIT